MSKFSKFKEWLTVKDVAKRLSISAGEDVTEADVLRFVLDGHLTLSVYFVNHARGRPVRIEPLGDQHFGYAPSLLEPDQPKRVVIAGELLPNGKEVLIYKSDMQMQQLLVGVWDLMMLGGERSSVEREYQNLTAGPEVSLTCFEAPIVANQNRTEIFQILNSCRQDSRLYKELINASKDPNSTITPMEVINNLNNESSARERSFLDYETIYYPAETLPDDSIFVVREAALQEFEEKVLADDRPQEKPLHSSERKSAAQIIAVLAEMAGLDISAPYAADVTLREVAAGKLELPNSPETVVKFLKAAAELAGKA